jgi:hypothetical protein
LTPIAESALTKSCWLGAHSKVRGVGVASLIALLRRTEVVVHLRRAVLGEATVKIAGTKEIGLRIESELAAILALLGPTEVVVHLGRARAARVIIAESA